MIPQLSARLRAGFAFAALASFAACAVAQGAPVPVETFFQHPSFSNATISPTGRHVAVLVAPKAGRVQLVVVNTETLAAKVAAGFGDVDIESVRWVSDKRLVFTVTDRSGESLGNRLHSGSLVAVDADGGQLRHLARSQWAPVSEGTLVRKLLDPSAQFHSTVGKQDSDEIFVTVPNYLRPHELDAHNLLRLNTRTGDSQQVHRPARAMRWVVDHQGVPRIAVSNDKAQATVWLFDPAANKWESIAQFDSFGADGFAPVGFAPDGTLFAAARRKEGTGAAAVHRYDLAKRELDKEPLIAAEGFDLEPALIVSRGQLVGMRYVTDAEGTAWFDDEHKQLQSKVDQAFPGTINRIGLPQRPEVPIVLVTSYSDRDPGAFSIYNRQTGKATTLGRAMPDIDPAQMAQRDFVRLKARDGLDIPAWLTLPKGAKGRKLPMVVLVHGGPWVRGGFWNWNAQAQFLANRGYAVLEPEFRGSIGYGFRHFKAGWKQWGLAMQNDVADAAKWAIDKGIADARRICIAGASYGGYATLMGLINDPELFRCGVNWVGVTDVALMYSVSWSDMSQEFQAYGMPMLIGDQEKDAAQLKATSPLANAAKITQPLLLAYGGNDIRVPIVHGTAFRDAVKKTNPDVEWVEYKDEWHGWYTLKTRTDFWTRVEKFLERNIGK